MVDKNKIIKLREQGLSYGSIAKMVGVSRARVHQICSGYKPPSYKNPIWKRIRKTILQRDNYKCQWGNVCKGKLISKEDLVVHHIDFNDRNNEHINLITLCRYCHASFHATNHIDKNILKNLEPKRVIKICKVCKKEFWIRNNSRKTCSDECFRKRYPVLSQEERRIRFNKRMREYIKERYKNDKDFRDKVNKRNKKYTLAYYLKNRHTEKFKKRQKENQQRNYYKDVNKSREKSRIRYRLKIKERGRQKKQKIKIRKLK